MATAEMSKTCVVRYPLNPRKVQPQPVNRTLIVTADIGDYCVARPDGTGSPVMLSANDARGLERRITRPR